MSYYCCLLITVLNSCYLLVFLVLNLYLLCFALSVLLPALAHMDDKHSLVGKTTALWLDCEESAWRQWMGLLGDGRRAIPRTGGWGRELVIEATPAPCRAHSPKHTHSLSTQKHNLCSNPLSHTDLHFWFSLFNEGQRSSPEHIIYTWWEQWVMKPKHWAERHQNASSGDNNSSFLSSLEPLSRYTWSIHLLLTEN